MTMPAEHTKLLDDALGQILRERRRWPMRDDSADADHVAVLVREEARADPNLLAAANRAVRLKEQLEAARLDLARATHAADQAAAAIPAVLYALGDVEAAEDDRDVAQAAVAKWTRRVGDLTAAGGEAEAAVVRAGREATARAAGHRLAAATEAAHATRSGTDELVARFRRELAAALYAESAAGLVLGRLQTAGARPAPAPVPNPEPVPA